MKKWFVAAGIGAAGLMLSSAALARVDIGVSIGIPGVVYPAPVYVAPAPVYAPPPVVHYPAPVYVRPQVVYPAPVYYGGPATTRAIGTMTAAIAATAAMAAATGAIDRRSPQITEKAARMGGLFAARLGSGLFGRDLGGWRGRLPLGGLVAAHGVKPAARRAGGLPPAVMRTRVRIPVHH